MQVRGVMIVKPYQMCFSVVIVITCSRSCEKHLQWLNSIEVDTVKVSMLSVIVSLNILCN